MISYVLNTLSVSAHDTAKLVRANTAESLTELTVHAQDGQVVIPGKAILDKPAVEGPAGVV